MGVADASRVSPAKHALSEQNGGEVFTLIKSFGKQLLYVLGAGKHLLCGNVLKTSALVMISKKQRALESDGCAGQEFGVNYSFLYYSITQRVGFV